MIKPEDKEIVKKEQEKTWRYREKVWTSSYSILVSVTKRFCGNIGLYGIKMGGNRGAKWHSKLVGAW